MRTIGLPSRRPSSTTSRSPPGRLTMRPPGSVIAADFVSAPVTTALTPTRTISATTTPIAIFQPLAMPVVTLAGTDGEVRYRRRCAALGRAHGGRQQECRPADPCRLPADRRGAGPAPGAADP